MKKKKIIRRSVLLLLAVALIYMLVWAQYRLRCEGYRKDLINAYGTDYVKLEKNGFQCRMPRFLQFDAAFIGLTYIDLEAYSNQNVERFTVPVFYVCPKAFGGFVVATYAGEQRYTGENTEDGSYIYSYYRNGYLELDEKLQPINEDAKKMWEKYAADHEELKNKMNEIWGFFD